MNTDALMMKAFLLNSPPISNPSDSPRAPGDITMDPNTTTRLLMINMYAVRFDTGFPQNEKGEFRVEHQVWVYDEELIDVPKGQRLPLNISFPDIVHDTSPTRGRLPTKRADRRSTLV